MSLDEQLVRVERDALWVSYIQTLRRRFVMLSDMSLRAGAVYACDTILEDWVAPDKAQGALEGLVPDEGEEPKP